METILYFVRHGETANNHDHRFCGSRNCPLDERGLAQAACLRPAFAARPLDAIYSSPLDRAAMTAEQIRGDREMPIIIDNDLAEINCGPWEGLNAAEIEARWPGLLRLWQHTPDELSIPGGETFEQVQSRAVDAVVRIVQKERGHAVAVAGHMLMIQLIMAKLMNIPIREVWNIETLGNTAVSTLRIYDNGELEVLGWGDVSHLPPELRAADVPIAGFTPSGEEPRVIRVSGRHSFVRFAAAAAE